MSKNISLDRLSQLATQYGYEPNALRAVIQVETPGYGFHPKTGNILINFEPHIYKRYSKILIPDGDGTQTSQWVAYEKAKKFYPTYAMLSTSWGMGQVMGFNFATLGYANVQDMVHEFIESEENQVLGMLLFIKGNPRLHKALKVLDWRTFAYYYNGEKYFLNKYDEKLKAAHQRLSQGIPRITPLVGIRAGVSAK